MLKINDAISIVKIMSSKKNCMRFIVLEIHIIGFKSQIIYLTEYISFMCPTDTVFHDQSGLEV